MVGMVVGEEWRRLGEERGRRRSGWGVARGSRLQGEGAPGAAVPALVEERAGGPGTPEPLQGVDEVDGVGVHGEGGGEGGEGGLAEVTEAELPPPVQTSWLLSLHLKQLVIRFRVKEGVDVAWSS